jgi:hypothetical protein
VEELEEGTPYAVMAQMGREKNNNLITELALPFTRNINRIYIN